MKHNNIISFDVPDGSAAVPAYTRMTITANADGKSEFTVAGATGAWVGSLLQDVDGTIGTERGQPRKRHVADVQHKGFGTHYAIADGAIAAGGAIGAAAAGEITAGGTLGIALDAAAADGDIIRVFYYNNEA